MSQMITCPHCMTSIDGSSVAAMKPIQAPPVAENLVDSNEPPLHTFQHLTDKLNEARSRLEFVKDEVARMEQNIRVFSEERDRLEGFVATYKRVLNPVRRLPDEVLRGIFWACVDDEDLRIELYLKLKGLDFDPDSLSPKGMSWTLGQVSHCWREVALSYPSLWSSVDIKFPPSGSSKEIFHKMAAQLVRQLRRSETSMLSVTLNSTHTLDNSNSLLLAICSHSRRWESLRAKLSSQNICILDDLIGGGTPNLRRLYLQGWDYPAGLGEVSMFQASPKLHDVTVEYSTGLDYLYLPWSRITRLRLRVVGSTAQSSSPANYSYLCNMPNLKSLYIFATNFDGGMPEVSLPFLRYLAIHWKASSGIQTFLERIHASNLQELRIHAPNVPMSEFEIPARLTQTLRSLCLDMGRLKCVQSLTNAPLLESLSLRNPRYEIISDLAARDPSTGTLQSFPRLRDVGLYAPTPIACDDPSLLQLLDSRFRLQPNIDTTTITEELRLRKVRIHRNVSLQESTLQQLEAMAAQGLQVDTSPK
ncbi:hypothetical protein V5O48_011473, partial [Marasmius crinis-equi]